MANKNVKTINQLDPMGSANLSDHDLLIVYDVDQTGAGQAAQAKKLSVQDLKGGLEQGHRIVQGIKYNIKEEEDTLEIQEASYNDKYAQVIGTEYFDGLMRGQDYQLLHKNLKNNDTISDLEDKVDNRIKATINKEDSTSETINISNIKSEGNLINLKKENEDTLIISANVDESNYQNAYDKIQIGDTVIDQATQPFDTITLAGSDNIKITKTDAGIEFSLQGEVGSGLEVKNNDDTQIADRLLSLKAGEGFSFEKQKDEEGQQINNKVIINNTDVIKTGICDTDNNSWQKYVVLNSQLKNQTLLPIYFTNSLILPENELLSTYEFFINNKRISHFYINGDRDPSAVLAQVVDHYALFIYNNNELYLIASDRLNTIVKEQGGGSSSIDINIYDNQDGTIKVYFDDNHWFNSLKDTRNQPNGLATLNNNNKLSNEYLQIIQQDEQGKDKINKDYLPEDIGVKTVAIQGDVSYANEVITFEDTDGSGSGSSASAIMYGTCMTTSGNKNKKVIINTSNSIGLSDGDLIAIYFNNDFGNTEAELIICNNKQEEEQGYSEIKGQIYYENLSKLPINLITEKDLVLFLFKEEQQIFNILSIDSVSGGSLVKIENQGNNLLGLETRNGTKFVFPTDIFDQNGIITDNIVKYLPQDLWLYANIYEWTQGDQPSHILPEENINLPVNRIENGENIDFSIEEDNADKILKVDLSEKTKNNLTESIIQQIDTNILNNSIGDIIDKIYPTGIIVRFENSEGLSPNVIFKEYQQEMQWEKLGSAEIVGGRSLQSWIRIN